MKTICVATDFFVRSDRALQHATLLGKPFKTRTNGVGQVTHWRDYKVVVLHGDHAVSRAFYLYDRVGEFNRAADALSLEEASLHV